MIKCSCEILGAMSTCASHRLCHSLCTNRNMNVLEICCIENTHIMITRKKAFLRSLARASVLRKSRHSETSDVIKCIIIVGREDTVFLVCTTREKRYSQSHVFCVRAYIFVGHFSPMFCTNEWCNNTLSREWPLESLYTYIYTYIHTYRTCLRSMSASNAGSSRK
jgi:hypothetical protein